MNFTSISYLLFFILISLLYFSVSKKYRYLILLIGSYYFYSVWSFKYSLLMALSTLITYFTSLTIDKYRERDRIRKSAVFVCFSINLLILFLFKYFNFSIDMINRLFLRSNPIAFRLDFLLPVGISFYTFQALGYTIDVYRGEIEPERNLLRYALFVSFFPQLVAGPIERSSHLLPQLKEPKNFTYENFTRGLSYIVWGVFLKLVLADRLALLVDSVFPNYLEHSSLMTLLVAIAFSFQIYCDFYSYSIIAKGSARILGIDLMDNFNAPFLARSLGEFWRRWHISLSTWFRDYLYIPLGGSRRGRIRTYINQFIVFIVSGLWHGASLNFLIWGMIHGTVLFLENISLNRLKIDNLIYNIFRRLISFFTVVLAFIFFRSRSVRASIYMVKNILSFDFSIDRLLEDFALTEFNPLFLYPLLIGLLILVLVDILKYNKFNLTELLDRSRLIRWPLYLLLILAIMIFGIYGPGYDPKAFIYFQF